MPRRAPHVLQVVGSSVFGGATRVILAISKGLLAEGYQVSILTSCEKTQQAFAELGAGVVPCRFYTRDVSPVRDMAAVAETVAACRRLGVDVLHTHTSKGGAVGRVAARLLRMPVVHTVHGFAFNEFTPPRTRALYTAIERGCARMTTRMVMINEDEYRMVLDGGWLPARRCVKILNGIPVPPMPEPVTPHNGAPLLVTVGRLAEQKGYTHLLRAMPLVLRAYPQARLAIVGDGELRGDLAAQTAYMGLSDAVQFTGFQPDPLAWLAKAHVAVSSSLWEGLPIAVLEMMAARRPIVATTCRGTREVLAHGVDALLAPCADPEALGESIVAMLDDQARAARMADAARAKLERDYQESRMVDEYVALFREIVPIEKGEAWRQYPHAA